MTLSPKISMRKTYADLLRLALPVMLTQLGQVVVQLCDNMMVGRLGALPLAGVSFGGTVFFIIFALAIGFTLGLTPLVGELFAQNRKEEVAGYLQNSIVLYLTMGVIFVALLLAAVPLMHYLGQPEEVVEVAIPYFKYLAWSVLPFMLFASFKQFLEGIGNTKVAMTIVVISNALNILLNWVFIFGKFGAPELGAAGAGLSTLIARALTPVMMIAYFLSKKEFRSYFDYFSWRKMMGLSREGNRYCKELFRVGLPIAGHLTLENSAFCITSLMMGWIGTVEIAANQITTTMANVAFMMVVGIGSATTILTSHAYGARDRAQIKAVSRASYTVGLAWNTITALSFILLRNHIPLLFTDDPEVVRTAATLLVCCGLFQFSDGLQCISTGLLRGIKDVAVILRIALVAYVIINVPLGYLLCFVVGWGAPALWVGFIAGLTIAAVLLIRRFRRQLSSDDLFARAE